MEVEEDNPPPILSQTLQTFDDYIAVYSQCIPEKTRIEKRLTEIKEYGKNKRVKCVMPRYPERTHWDFMMAEMKWLAADFNEERKRFAKKRKEINKSILSVSKLKKEAKQRKRQELMKEQKVVAKHISKHISMYWNKIDKIVVYKHKGQLYERRSELMDRHLQFMLKQTEDYTMRLSKNIKDGSTNNGEEFHIPFLLNPKYTLRPYQEKGLEWLVSLYEQGLSGILADEMGLGKTLQTITLLAYLAAYKGIWGPHLIIVPTSTMLNWECEFKRFCPSMKVLTYYGTMKERQEKRKGWSQNNFQVCITSYQLAIKDVSVFRRKKWVYMILDEAHNIKNFQSERWQILLHFNTKRRLLLTGTPLQNSLMELWSLMHFLMPALFRSRGEFAFWFSNPLNQMVEGERSINTKLVHRLHEVLRPFILRRLKSEVEKEMPKKYFHIVNCPLSKRQRYLYEDYIGRRKTKEQLASGSFLSMMGVLMQLRKVCNHPDLFETRPITSPFITPNLTLSYPKCVFIEDLNKVHSHAYNQCYIERDEHSLTNQASLNQDLTDASLEANDWRHILSFFPSSCQFVDRVQNSLLLSKEQDTQLAYQMRQELACSYESFLQEMKSNQLTFSSSSPYLNEIESTLFNVPLFSSPSKSWSSSTKAVVNCYLNNQVHDLLLHQEERVLRIAQASHQAVTKKPLYGIDCIDTCSIYHRPTEHLSQHWSKTTSCLQELTPSFPAFCAKYQQLVQDFTILVEPTRPCYPIQVINQPLSPPSPQEQEIVDSFTTIPTLHSWSTLHSIQFPEKRLVEYDCGKLQVLSEMLPRLRREGHRCLLFTQMSRMLDIFEIFLNMHHFTYLRMDGATSLPQRQKMMEKFNNDSSVFIFILSTRSGGLGINLIGADTVIFYDSDWNPAMDAQAQDRAHRIGQTRDVHIYRLISESTIEENILKKANQKRHLSQLSLEEGKFTTQSFIQEMTIADILGTQPEENQAERISFASLSNQEVEKTMREVEDTTDALAAEKATAEAKQEEMEDIADVEEAPVGGKEIKKEELAFEQSIERAASEVKTELKAWAGKDSEHLRELERSLPLIQQRSIRFKEVCEPIPEVTPEALKAELDGLEEEEREWEEEQVAAMKEAEEEIQRKDNDPTLLETTGVGTYEDMKKAYLSYRKDIKAKIRKAELTGKVSI